MRVAFVHHALHMGGVERQIELTWSAVQAALRSERAHPPHARVPACAPRVVAEVLLFQQHGAWAGRIEALGLPVSVFPVYECHHGPGALPNACRVRPRAGEEQTQRLIQALRGFDLAHVWYGGGELGSMGAFATLVAPRRNSRCCSRIFSLD